MIEDDARFGALILHHASCRWPEARLTVHSPRTQGAVSPEFLAQGFDAVLVAGSGTDGCGLDWLRNVAGRPGFAPLVFLSSDARKASARKALALGAQAVLDRANIEHGELIAVLAAAAEKQAIARANWRTAVDAHEAQRFSGAFVPGYRRIRQLAGGRVSDLYLAESEQAGTLVVLKVARDREKENELDQSFLRFLQEYEIVRRIIHPSIVRLYDLGVSDEHAYLVMEYFRAGDLRTRMKTGLAPREALRVAAAIAEALQAIHAAGILHRDLKPGNVMLRDDGSVALIDFGLAKDAALNVEITDRGFIFGTPHYMSPEQGHGEPIDERSDLYSLGVILFEMLARAKPFADDNPMAIIYKHRHSPIPRVPAQFAPLQGLIDSLLAKQPADRLVDAATAAAALTHMAEELAG
ncbi:MAG TPA: serine/threonine-protein kinase [Steroidobacteraceae bacterium]|nr:serine/threonine-protein kinase [Steroidobacteraceae bacterium]